jgi:anti-sigma B factor antagonist
MQLTIELYGTVTVFQLAGQLDAHASQELHRAAQQSIADGSARLVFNLAALNYTSSAGLRVLLGATQAARQKNGDVCLAAVQSEVAKVFALSGLDALLKIYPDTQTAVASFIDQSK